jgi:hypothetical protein
MSKRSVLIVLGVIAGVVALCCAVSSVIGAVSDPKPVDRAAVSPSAVPSGTRLSPGPEARAAYLAGLDAIDRDIVHGKPDTAVSRGLNTCADLRQWPGDRARLVQRVQQRYTSPAHPDGVGAEVSGRILDVVQGTLCP